MSVDWSNLPPELVESIAEYLKNYTDYLRSRAVCRNWRSYVPKIPTNLPSQLPWLMLPRGRHNDNNNNPKRAFFSLSDNKFHILNLPEPSRHKRRCGSSHGWLAIVDESPAFFLLNAVTNCKIDLPSLSTFPMVVDFDFSKIGREYTLRTAFGEEYSRSLREMRDSFVKKFVLSSCPMRDDSFTAVALLACGEFAYWRKGGKCWSIIGGTMQSYWEDVVYHDRDKCFYAVNGSGRVAVCYISGDLPRFWMIDTRLRNGGDVHYLASSGKELLLVSRYLGLDHGAVQEQPNVVYKTMKFVVAKLDQIESKWDQVTSLGDEALFIGENSSLCLTSSNFEGCKSNCIYFTDDYSEGNYDGVWADYDLGIFYLTDGRIDPLTAYAPNSRSTLRSPPPVWVTPNPC